LLKKAAYPSREIDRITRNLTDKINEVLESDTVYKNFILEMIAGTIKPEYKKYIPTVNIKNTMETI